MTSEPTPGTAAGSSSHEADRLRARLAALEEEQAERVARAHAALAAAQDRAYWLDRWGVDLNALMRRRGAGEVRFLLRVLRSVARALIKARRAVEDMPRQARRTHASALDVGDDAPVAPGGGFVRSLSPDPLRAAPVTDELFGRLDDAEVAAIEERAGAGLPADAGPDDRRRMLLSLGVHYEAPGVLEKTGLSAATPPDEVHSMGRGPFAAGGSPYYADLVADGFATAGMPIEPGMRCLDFGCSSGRVVRVLYAALGECEWHGCDPIPDAVEWAQANLDGATFMLSPQAPPLPYDDGAFDRVYAISIWSHFAEAAALAWLREMRRVIRPGGGLLLTTHGYQTMAHDYGADRRSAEQLGRVRTSLYEKGFWFENEFGEAGDHGVANSDWGTAFLTPEWLLTRVTPDWRLRAFAPGRVEDNQDMYVLERV